MRPSVASSLRHQTAVLSVCLSGMLLSGCFRSTELADINCKDNASCPSGYVCVRPGQPGGCEKITDGGRDLGVFDGAAGGDVVEIDAGLGIDVGLSLDTNNERSASAVDQGLDVPVDSTGPTSEAGLVPDIPHMPDLGLGGAGGQGGGADGSASAGGNGGTAVDAAERDAPINGNGGAGGGSGGSGGSVPGTGGIVGGTGGMATGGVGSGGSGTGGIGTGGSGTGGSGTGGSGTGGSGSGTGGVGTGGSGAGGTLARPPGYWMASDWGLTDVSWAGCVWTQPYDDPGASSPTTISPADFTTSHQPFDPYRVSGSIFDSYNSVARIGFNLTEAVTDDANQCVHKTMDSTTVLSPGAKFPLNMVALSIDWQQDAASPLRVELLGADGFANAAHRWCVNIKDAGGTTVVPLSAFNTQCWKPTAAGNYNGEEISAIAFHVPGTVSGRTAFDYTIKSFRLLRGIGGLRSADSNFQKVKVADDDGRQYIIQNNNFGASSTTLQTLLYAANSFKILESTVSSATTPAAFPSVYVGANGNILGGALVPADDNLPMQIAAMVSANSSFAWTGGTGSKSFNAVYDLWFAKTSPADGAYEQPISGKIMVWLYKPADHLPPGGLVRRLLVGGHTWDVWNGPIGESSPGTDDAGRPVLSYVAQDSPIASLTLDLKTFITDAITNAEGDKARGGTSQAFANTWYLTDVFGGFQIWSGADAVGLQCTNFTCKVQ